MHMLMSYQRSDLGFPCNVCRGPSAVRQILGLQAVMAPWPGILSGPPPVPSPSTLLIFLIHLGYSWKIPPPVAIPYV